MPRSGWSPSTSKKARFDDERTRFFLWRWCLPVSLELFLSGKISQAVFSEIGGDVTYRSPIPANSGKYRAARSAFMKKQGSVGRCAICGGQIDMALSGRTANGPSVDHIVATSAGGSFHDLGNWQLSHRRCNSAKGRGEGVGPAYRDGSGGSRQSSRFPADGHWNDKPDGREWASPNGLGCDNRACRRCMALHLRGLQE